MKFKSGQMMLEVLFALSVVVVVLVALMAGAVVSVRNTRFAKNTVLANHYAQEGIEKARKERDRADSWDIFKSTFAPGVESVGGIFERTISVDDQGDKIIITATVNWTESGRDHESKAVTILSKWSR